MIPITGVILAGGQGKRMANPSLPEDIEKGLVNFLGEPMVMHVAKRLTQQVSEVLINANQNISAYLALGYPVVSDSIPGFAGPLAGLHAGIQAAKTHYVMTVPCDAPLLALDLTDRLLSALLGSRADVAVAKTGKQVHPVFCLCGQNLLAHLETYLLNGGRKFDAWYETLSVIEVPFNDNPNAFANINTPYDLIKLENTSWLL